MNVTCPCCGHLSLPAEEGGFCEVCAWDERDPEGGWTGKPRRGLAEAQRAFRTRGVSDPALAELARAPRPDEAPPPWWHAFDDEPAVVIALIEDAFRDVTLDGGVSLDEAELIDDYALPSRTEHDPPPPGHGSGPPWQDLTRAGLERFAWGNFPFQDARGIRYHAPAFACATLRGPAPGGTESLIYALESGHQLAAVVRVCDDAQRHALARFLAHLAVADGYHSSAALRALRDTWGAYLDPAHLAYVLR